MRSLAAAPQAFWFTSGTPKQVRKDVDRTVDAATKANAVAVLVAYNVPGRDCGGYSSVMRLRRSKCASVYVDAGHSRWQPAKTMARRLKKVGARAFALNGSNFRATDELVAYGTEISTRLGQAHFVIDTSRNAPKAGRWWPRYALGLARRANPPLP